MKGKTDSEKLAYLAALSLISDEPKKEIARRLGIEPNCRAFIEKIASDLQCSESEAKLKIANNINLLRIMFILA